MKKFILLLFVFAFTNLFACTTFFINKNGEMIFGRNYDWITDAGMVCTNLRGLEKTSMKKGDNKTITWTSKYGSVSFNQYGKEFPTGGMNEKGLVVELMWNDGTAYPKPDDRPALGVLQWIQYQLDNHATIDEVIASDKTIRIGEDNPPLHYLVADEKGNAASIEFFDGKMVVHKGKDLPFPVLTNNPYKESAQTALDAKVLAGNKSFSFRDNSLQRFTQTCSMVQQFNNNEVKKPLKDHAFDILDKVAQQGWTRWSIVYDIKNKKIDFKTINYPQVKSLELSSFDFSCKALPLALDMNQEMKGNINKNFAVFSEALNRKILEKAVTESKSQVEISDKSKEASLAYAGLAHCQ